MNFIKLASKKSVMGKEKYSINSKYFDSLNIETLKNILNEANRLLDDSQESITSITNKANDLFKIIIVALFALVAYVFTNDPSMTIKTLSIYYIVSLTALTIMLYSIIYPKLNALKGIEPKKVIDDIMIKSDINKNEKRFLFVFIQDSQIAIDNNLELHHSILTRYKTVIKAMLIIISVSIFILFPMVRYLTPFLHTYCHP